MTRTLPSRLRIAEYRFPARWVWHAALLSMLAGAAQAETADAWLRESLGFAGGTGRPGVVRALRQLNDPTLRPVFHSLVSSTNPRLRVEARLGMASLRDPARIPLTELAELDGETDRTERRLLIAAALDEGWLDPRDTRTMLSWGGLDPGVQLLLWLDRIERGEPIADPTGLKALLHTPDERHAKLAALLLHHLRDADGTRELHALLNDESVSAQTYALLLQTIASHHMASAGGFALSVAEQADDAPLRELALRAALGVGAPGAGRVWRARFENNDADTTEQTKLALLALRGYPGTPPVVFETLSGSDDVFIQALGRAGHAVTIGSDDAVNQLNALLGFDSAVASAWVLTSAAREFPSVYADAAYREVTLKYRPGRTETRERRVNEVVQAVQAWVEMSGDAGDELRRRWTDQPDPRWREAVLLGLLRHGGSRAAETAGKLEAGTTGPLRLLSALILARQSGTELSPADLATLRDGAEGNAGLGDGLRAQACWLWLKHAGGIERVRSGV